MNSEEERKDYWLAVIFVSIILSAFFVGCVKKIQIGCILLSPDDSCGQEESGEEHRMNRRIA